MIHTTVLEDGSVLLRSSLRVEIHRPDGTVLEGRDVTPTERADHLQWESTHDRLSPASSPKTPRRLGKDQR